VATPRPLTERERDTLDLMLSLEAPGLAELREQAATARVSSECPCGCANIDLEVDRNASPPSQLGRRYGPAITAMTRPLPLPPDETSWGEKNPNLYFEVSLDVDEAGWLSRLEIDDFATLDGKSDAHPFPPREDFYPPRLEPAPRRRRRWFGLGRA
jgi:hypothetical protein